MTLGMGIYRISGTLRGSLFLHVRLRAGGFHLLTTPSQLYEREATKKHAVFLILQMTETDLLALWLGIRDVLDYVEGSLGITESPGKHTL
jgi:hypothetical protein